jgi:hypothetical protein
MADDEREEIKAALLDDLEQRRTDRERAELIERLAGLAQKGKLTAKLWGELIEGRSPTEAVRYNVEEPLQPLQLVDHPRFGLGVVAARADERKVYVLFEDRERLMLCGPASYS